MSPLISICLLLGLADPELSRDGRAREGASPLVDPFEARQGPTTVRLQVRTIPGDAHLPTLQDTLTGDLIMRLLEDGYRVLGFDSPADITIEIALTSHGAALEAKGQGIRNTTIAPAEPSIFSIELQQWMIAFADEVRPQPEMSQAAAREATTEPHVDPVRTSKPAAEEEPPPVVAARSDWRAAVLAKGGILIRAPYVDGVVGLGVRLGKRRGPGGAIEVDLVPSRAGVVRILEFTPQAAFDWRFIRRQRLLVAPGVLAGAHLHRYDYLGELEGGGVHRGFSARARCQVGFFARQGALVLLTAFVGFQAVSRWYRNDGGQSLWHRRYLAIGLDLSVGWDFQLRASTKGTPE